MIHFIFPNAAFKYRQGGPYKVEGVKEMVEQIYNNHMKFLGVIHYLLTYSLLQLTAYVACACGDAAKLPDQAGIGPRTNIKSG